MLPNKTPRTFNKKDFEKEYKQIGKVYSPFFNEKINFDFDGWNHLLKSRGLPRTEEELSARLPVHCLQKSFLQWNIAIENMVQITA